MGKEHTATEVLINKIISGSMELDLFECVDAALGLDNYLKIGKTAIKNELEILNSIPTRAGIKIIRVGKYKTLNENLHAGWKVAGWAILTLLSRSLGLVALIAMAGISAGTAEEKMKKMRRRVMELRNEQGELSIEEAQSILDNKAIVFSLGAGGIKGMFIPGEFTCYMINYPKYKFKNEAAKKAFLNYLISCKAVPNSMFCWIGSGRKYKNALKYFI